METLERLQEAIKNGEVLRVKYEGGSQPGSIREIAPISISGDKVLARCFASNAAKMFVIDKIDICDGVCTDATSREDPAKKDEYKYDNLMSLFECHASEFQLLGWHIGLGDNEISLHRRFKNGKPLKGADVSLYFDEYTSDLVVDVDGELHEENVRKKQKPWMVSAKGMNTRSYGSLDKAAALFIEQANRLAPNSK